MLTTFSLALLATVLSLLTPSNANPFPKPPATAQLDKTCRYTTTRGAELALLPLPLIGPTDPSLTLAECRDACTRDLYCGNVAYRPAQNTSDHNCAWYQQFYHEPVPTKPAPASHVVLAVKPKSCGKGPAKPRGLKCVPGTVTPKGSTCQYNVTCGRTLAPKALFDFGESGDGRQTGAASPEPDLHSCLMTVSPHPNPSHPPRPFLGSQVGEAVSYTDGGFCFRFQSAYYDKRPTVGNKYGFVYQIVETSCGVKAATPE